MWRIIQAYWFGFRLQTGKPAARRSAAQALSRLPGDAAVGQLCRSLGETDENVLCAIIDALSKHKNRKAVAPLQQVLENAMKREQWAIWLACASALGELRAVEAVEAIVTPFSDDSPMRSAIPDHVHHAALRVLGQIGDGRGAVVALFRLSSARGELPVHVRLCLQQIGPAAIEPLRAELVRRRWGSIAEALALFDWQPETQAERIAWSLARPQRELLAAEGAAAIEPMRLWYLRNGADERRLLAPYFGRMPPLEVGPVLLQLLRDSNVEAERSALIEQLGVVRCVKAVPELVDLLGRNSGSPLAEVITTALIRIGTDSSRPVQEALASNRLFPRHAPSLYFVASGRRTSTRHWWGSWGNRILRCGE